MGLGREKKGVKGQREERREDNGGKGWILREIGRLAKRK